MSDRQAVLLAVVIGAGALLARPLPLMLALVIVGVAFALQRPWVLILGAGVLASALGATAMAGLHPPPSQSVDGRWVTLLTDPAPNDFGSVGADVRIGHRHAQAFARSPAASAFMKRLAGEKVRVTGRLEPVTGVARQRLVPRHIASRLSIEAATGVRSANVVGAMANAYRRVVARGAEALPQEQRPLFGGMVLGDDRGQSPELQDAFRAAGLTHLMVVSGENMRYTYVL